MDKPWLAHYEEGVPAHIEIPDVLVPHNLIRSAEIHPDHTALIYGNVVAPLGNRLLDAKMSYRRLLDLTTRFAASLQQAGVRKGDRVVVHLPNCPQFIIAYYATLMVGGIVVPSNPEYVARELSHQVNDCGAETIITLSLTYPLVKRIRAQTPLRQVIVTNVKEYFPWPLRALFTLFKERKEGHYQRISGHAGAFWFQDLLGRAPSQPLPVDVDPQDTAVLMYTGGTTGTIKGAQLTHRNIQANTAQIRAWFPDMYEGQETILAALPFYHSYGMTTCMNLGIRTRTTLLLIVNPRVLIHILTSIERHRPTFYPGVPAFYASINEHPRVNQHDLSAIKACISGAAPLPPEVQRRFEALTGGRLVEGYGLSEATPVTHVNPVFGENRIGTIGLPLCNTEAKIVDIETGTRALPPGEDGELIVRGPQVMKGYWHMPTETANVLRDGWLYTGDIARMDRDGYFQIVERKKQLILSAGGHNVYPREIEAVLGQHPNVSACAAVGIPHAGKGERVKVFVVLKENMGADQADAADIIAFCRERLAPYKVPKVVEFRDQLPTTALGKVMRHALIDPPSGRGQAPSGRGPDSTGSE